jgi:hypothetical protein
LTPFTEASEKIRIAPARAKQRNAASLLQRQEVVFNMRAELRSMVRFAVFALLLVPSLLGDF